MAFPRRHNPDPALLDYVECIWTAERLFAPPNDSFTVLPDSFVELIFSFGPSLSIDDGHSLRPAPRCYVVGLLDKPFQIRANGIVKTVAVRFHPWGFFPLFSITPEPSARTIASAALKASLQNLTDSIQQAVESDQTERAVMLLNEYLLSRLRNGNPRRDVTQVASQRLMSRKGQLRTDDLAIQSDVSRRQLERGFRKQIGSSPKQLARRIRFEQVRNRLFFEPDVGLAELAYACGYADQAHMNREFKVFSNRTPKQFVADMQLNRTWFRTQGVAFLQD
ncbi:MAG: AraC family transcriptional regulator [Spirosoma sp.]|nr:AraC family transcriptional regulator [Spirosoma sp.]